MRKMIILCCLALGACMTSGKRGGDGALAVYDLGLPAETTTAAAGEPSVAVEVRAPYWLDSLAIEYRLAYAETARLRDYAQARWAGPPANLIQQRLIQQNGFLASGQGGARCLIRLEVDEFSQVFDSPASSRGLLQVRATLLDPARNKLAEGAWKIEQVAPSPDSRGGVSALAAAVGQLGDKLAAWQGEARRQGAMNACAR